ncbi:Crp/Fnr family transcriptional regulator [Flavobacteriaceae bacterium F89]|uniref:Crp/Fnr family transcriptional regulator n=1 Tax=Cerina litoralis TaxID=2874477 RepID=A0AAE3EXG5_9FLAO|nr:Crp/Fnr family transcriptional regulator [Cerina litoralis]MCG2462033.1 Crp/Fnr family transcriptional regulator [Cerina litoralis]
MDNFKKYIQRNAHLSEEEFRLLMENIGINKVLKGSYIQRPGEFCRHSFFVERGLLRSYTIDKMGKEHIIQFGSENWIVTDRSSVLFNEPSELYIDAIEDTSYIALDSSFMKKAGQMSAAFQTFTERALHNHIRHQQKRINLLLSAPAEERYLNFIQLYPDVTQRVPQWMIASYLGITPESLSRVRKELVQKD